MCKIKLYTPQMNERKDSFSLCLDFYSMPSFRDDFVKSAKEKLNFGGFAERLLTEYEKQLIDIDSICSVLNNSIDEIISKKVYKLEHLNIENGNVDLYVSPYFVFVYCEWNNDNKDAFNVLAPIIDLLKERKLDMDIQNIAFTMNFKIGTDNANLWKIFDPNAFPTFDESTMTTGRYADSHQYDSAIVDLVRDVRIGVNEMQDGQIIEPWYFVHIKSVGNLLNAGRFFKENSIELLEDLYKKTRDEATKCFM